MEIKSKNAVWQIVGFVLQPFVGAIRYGALKMMKQFRAPDDERPARATAEHVLSEIVLPSCFRLFQDDVFRERARFHKLPRSEHDRIFNELEVAGICLAMFYLRMARVTGRVEEYRFWQSVDEHLPRELGEILKGYGVDSASAKLMRDLISMRRREYEELAEHVEKENSERVEFKELSSMQKQFAAVWHATAVGTSSHITRGNLQEGDPLTQYLIQWLLVLKQQVEKFAQRL